MPNHLKSAYLLGYAAEAVNFWHGFAWANTKEQGGHAVSEWLHESNSAASDVAGELDDALRQDLVRSTIKMTCIWQHRFGDKDHLKLVGCRERDVPDVANSLRRKDPSLGSDAHRQAAARCWKEAELDSPLTSTVEHLMRTLLAQCERQLPDALGNALRLGRCVGKTEWLVHAPPHSVRESDVQTLRAALEFGGIPRASEIKIPKVRSGSCKANFEKHIGALHQRVLKFLEKRGQPILVLPANGRIAYFCQVPVQLSKAEIAFLRTIAVCVDSAVMPVAFASQAGFSSSDLSHHKMRALKKLRAELPEAKRNAPSQVDLEGWLGRLVNWPRSGGLALGVPQSEIVLLRH